MLCFLRVGVREDAAVQSTENYCPKLEFVDIAGARNDLVHFATFLHTQSTDERQTTLHYNCMADSYR